VNLEEYLQDCDRRFDRDVQLVGMKYVSPGYHTQTPTGTWVHPVLQNFEYAVLLLRRRAPVDPERARAIIGRLLLLQDQDPVRPTYGIWPWLFEEPLEKMAPPDWNWADFCGGRICELLVESAGLLPKETVARLREALGHAAAAIFRRNMGPAYTNIAVMGGGVCAAAGEILDQPWLLDYGRRRLQSCVGHTEFHGGFNEYNSPTYTIVVVNECERILSIVRDHEVRESATRLHRLAWQAISEHFHPVTGQWAGPQARTYADRLTAATADILSVRTGVPISAARGGAEEAWMARANLTVRPLPCPPEFVSSFREPIAQPVERVHRFLRHADDQFSVRGTTWLTRDLCLGSVNREDFFYQRRPVLAYWRTEEDPAILLKLRFLHDGADFASALIRSAQCANRVLSAMNLLTDRGDRHPYFDQPGPDGFSVNDLRLRYEISGRGVQTEDLGQGLYGLNAGAWSAVIHTLPGTFGPWKVQWKLGSENDECWLDAICYSGPTIQLQREHFGEIAVAVGLELIPRNATSSSRHPCWQPPSPESSRVVWEDLSVTLPRRPEKYPN